MIATPTPAPTAVPTATPVPTAAPGANCTGNAVNKAFFVEAAQNLSFDVYCAALPSTWWVSYGSYTLPSGGKLTVYYTNSGGDLIRIQEGAFCTSGATACSPMTSPIGTAAFGPLGGSLGVLQMPMPNASVTTYPFYVLYVSPGTSHGYTMAGYGMSLAQFKSWAAAVVRVPKS